jgi:hypothetical protein
LNSVGNRHASENQYRSRIAFIPESMNPTLRVERLLDVLVAASLAADVADGLPPLCSKRPL